MISPDRLQKASEFFNTFLSFETGKIGSELCDAIRELQMIQERHLDRIVQLQNEVVEARAITNNRDREIQHLELEIQELRKKLQSKPETVHLVFGHISGDLYRYETRQQADFAVGQANSILTYLGEFPKDKVTKL